MKSAIKFHVEAFGNEVLKVDPPVLEVFVAEARRRSLMLEFPVDAPKQKIICALGSLGFRVVREQEHISMVRDNPDGSKTPLTVQSPETTQVRHLTDWTHKCRSVERCVLGVLAWPVPRERRSPVGQYAPLFGFLAPFGSPNAS